MQRRHFSARRRRCASEQTAPMPASAVAASTCGCNRCTARDVEYRIRHAGGHYVDVCDRAALIRDESGAVVRVIGCIDDVTTMHGADDILRDTERGKDEFLAVLAHELRNPMMPIRCALEVIAKAPSDEPAIKQAHAIIRRQFAQMVRLLDDMLDVSTMARRNVAAQGAYRNMGSCSLPLPRSAGRV